MKTISQIIDAARCQFKPDGNSNKQCGRKHKQQEGGKTIHLFHAFEIQNAGDETSYKKRGVICDKCRSQLSKKQYLFIPIGVAAELTAEYALQPNTGGNGNGGDSGENQKNQRHQGKCKDKKPSGQQNKQQANGLRLWPAREKELEQYVDRLFATADQHPAQAQA